MGSRGKRHCKICGAPEVLAGLGLYSNIAPHLRVCVDCINAAAICRVSRGSNVSKDCSLCLGAGHLSRAKDIEKLATRHYKSTSPPLWEADFSRRGRVCPECKGVPKPAVAAYPGRAVRKR